MKKKGFPEALVGEVMSLYEVQKTKFQGYSWNGQRKRRDFRKYWLEK